MSTMFTYIVNDLDQIVRTRTSDGQHCGLVTKTDGSSVFTPVIAADLAARLNGDISI